MTAPNDPTDRPNPWDDVPSPREAYVPQEPTAFWGRLLPLDVPSRPQAGSGPIIISARTSRIRASLPVPLVWNSWEDMAQPDAAEVEVGSVEELFIMETADGQRALFAKGTLDPFEELPDAFVDLVRATYRLRSYRGSLPLACVISTEGITYGSDGTTNVVGFALGRVAISPEGLFLEAGIVPCPPGEGFVPDPTATIHRVAARV